MAFLKQKTVANLTVDDMSAEHVDELLSTLEHTWVKVKKMKGEGRRASVVAQETDLMKSLDQLKTVMQGCLQRSKNHHELLVNIFGGDFLRISKASALLETIQYSKEYETGSHVQEAVAECVSVEKVLEDLGHKVQLQKVKVEAYVDLLQRTGHASEEEMAAAQAKKTEVLGPEPNKEDEAKKKAAEEEEEAKKKATEEEEAKKKAAEEEEAKKNAAEEEEAKKKAAEEEEAKKKAAEEEAAKKKAAEEEEAKKKAAEEEEAKGKAAEEEEAKKKATEEEEAKKKVAEEEEAKKKAVEEEEAKKKAAEEEEAKKKAAEEEEAKKKAAEEEEAKKKAAEEVEAKKKAAEEEEAKKKAAEEEEAKKKAAEEEDAKKKAAEEEEVKKKTLDEEERKKAEAEAKEAAVAAMKVRELPQLSHDRGLDLKAIHDRGIVEMVEHKVEEAPRPEPAPGIRFVVTNHPVEAGQHGTIAEPAGDGQWKVRLDDGSFCVLSPEAFLTAPPPVASVTLKKHVNFVGVHHGNDVTPRYSSPADADEILKNAAEILTIFDQVIVSVEGHTATPDDKMDAWAHSLAQARADKIKSVLVEKGIKADRLKPIGLPGKFGSGHHDLVLKVVSL